MMRLLFEFYLSTDIDNIKEQIRSDCPKTTFTGEQRVTVSVYDYTQRCEQTDFIDIRRKLFVGFLIIIGCIVGYPSASVSFAAKSISAVSISSNLPFCAALSIAAFKPFNPALILQIQLFHAYTPTFLKNSSVKF